MNAEITLFQINFDISCSKNEYFFDEKEEYSSFDS
jgi:hypothetical protein